MGMYPVPRENLLKKNHIYPNVALSREGPYRKTAVVKEQGACLCSHGVIDPVPLMLNEICSRAVLSRLEGKASVPDRLRMAVLGCKIPDALPPCLHGTGFINNLKKFSPNH